MMFALITLKTTIRRNDHCKGAQRAGLKLVEALQNHHMITEFRIRAKDSRIPFFRVGGHRGELRNGPIATSSPSHLLTFHALTFLRRPSPRAPIPAKVSTIVIEFQSSRKSAHWKSANSSPDSMRTPDEGRMQVIALTD